MTGPFSSTSKAVHFSSKWSIVIHASVLCISGLVTLLMRAAWNAPTVSQGVCTFAQRQKAMVQMLYSETMALEELLEESVNTLGPDARDILAQIRYVPVPGACIVFCTAGSLVACDVSTAVSPNCLEFYCCQRIREYHFLPRL